MLDLVTQGSRDGLVLGNEEEEEPGDVWDGGSWAPLILKVCLLESHLVSVVPAWFI